VILQLKVSTLSFFYGAGFSGPLSLDEIESNISNDHVSGTAGDKFLIKVTRATSITRANAQM
jgi:hypothetical protein